MIRFIKIRDLDNEEALNNIKEQNSIKNVENNNKISELNKFLQETLCSNENNKKEKINCICKEDDSLDLSELPEVKKEIRNIPYSNNNVCINFESNGFFPKQDEIMSVYLRGSGMSYEISLDVRPSQSSSHTYFSIFRPGSTYTFPVTISYRDENGEVKTDFIGDTITVKDFSLMNPVSYNKFTDDDNYNSSFCYNVILEVF